MSGYSIGRQVEYDVIADLAANGYATQRAASSKGVADVIAFKRMQALMVSCKKTTMPGPAERAELIRVADLLGGIGVPLVALKPLRRPLRYRRLTGPGPKDWVPWVPDEVAATCVHDDGREHPSDGTLPCTCDCGTRDRIHYAGCAYLEATSPPCTSPVVNEDGEVSW